MNTTAKGDAFEKRALGIIKNMIEEKRIAVMENAYTVQEKRPYYSHDRKGNIIFDLTIEVKPPDANKYSLIYIIECKDYKTPVSIDRLEAFCSKIEQVAPRNSKAIFITTSRFQKSARNYADSKGIMLIGVDSNNHYNIELYKKLERFQRINFFENLVTKLDTGEQYLEREVDKSIVEWINNIKFSQNIIRHYTKQDIELIANEALDIIDKEILFGNLVLTKEHLANYSKSILGFSVKNTDSSNILGCLNTEKSIIQVNHDLYHSRRYNFVLAHEIGHCILHEGYIMDSALLNIMPDSEYSFRTDRYTLDNDKNWIEWQANYFAVCLTMPKHPFIATLLYFQQRLGLREGSIYLDDQISNIKDFIKLINVMSRHLELSKTSVINRLKELEMLIDKSRLKSIGQIMNEYQSLLII